MSSVEKRQELKAKIEAAERRNEARTLGQLARETTDTATDFVKAHPLATVAGIAALGLAIGALTRPGRQAGRKAGIRASNLANYAAELGLAYASGLFDAAGDAAISGKDRLEDIGDAVSENAAALKRKASYSSGNAAAAARALTRRAGKTAGRTVRDMKSRIKK